MKTKLFAIIFLLIFYVPIFASEEGELTKANIKVYHLNYSNEHNISHVALSGDGNWVGIIYSWYDDNGLPQAKVTITDIQGNIGEQTILELTGNYAYSPKSIAINQDGSKVVVVSGNPSYKDYLGWYLIDVPSKHTTFFQISGGNYPEANFELNTLTDCGHYYSGSDKIGFLASYDLTTGDKIYYIEGKKNGIECSSPYRMPDGSFLFISDGIKYLPASSTSLENAQLISNKYKMTEIDAGDYMLVETDCKNVYYYHPITNEKRLIFTDDSNFGINGTGCTTSWIEMGINSQYTFTGDNMGNHIVQIYGDNFPQQGRYFTKTDIENANYLFEAGINYTNRDKHVSSDGTKIVIQAGKSYYDNTNYKLYVVEVLGNSSESYNNTSDNTQNSCNALLYEKDGLFYLEIPQTKYAETYFYKLVFQYFPTNTELVLFTLYDYKELLNSEINTNCIIPQITDNLDISIPNISFSYNGDELEFSGLLSVYDWNTGLFTLSDIVMKQSAD